MCQDDVQSNRVRRGRDPLARAKLCTSPCAREGRWWRSVKIPRSIEECPCSAVLIPSPPVIVSAALLAAPASALVSVEGSGEPMFTRTTTNTVFFRYQGDGFSTYRLHFRYIVLGNNSPVYEEATANLGNPGSTVGFANWTGLPGNAYNTLQQGSTYSICTQGETQDLAPPNWLAPTTNSTCIITEPKSVGTTIDTTPPAISVSVSGSDQFTKTVPIPVVIDYSDDLSFPYAANFICSRVGLDPAAAKAACDAPGAPPKYNYNANCSVPVNGTTLPSAKVNQFNCSVTDTPALPDGPVTVCAISANSSLPDVPGNANQITAADTAGLSSSQCGFVNVDRTAPQLSFTAPAAVKVGDLVSTAGTVTDAGFGAGPVVTWNWGDNTQASTGSSSTHTYTGAGTYTITMSSQDAVGNAGVRAEDDHRCRGGARRRGRHRHPGHRHPGRGHQHRRRRNGLAGADRSADRSAGGRDRWRGRDADHLRRARSTSSPPRRSRSRTSSRRFRWP